MNNKIKVWLDVDRQLIFQELAGDLYEDDIIELFDATAVLVKKLKEPGHIRIVVDMRNVEKCTLKARRYLLKGLGRNDVKRIAVWGANSFIRTIFNLSMKAKKTSKSRMFSSQEKAVEWVLD